MSRFSRFLIPIVLFGFSSCTTFTLDLTKIDVLDGINAEEAKIIAQAEIAQTELRHSRDVTRPDIQTGPEAQEYPDYWFVSFPTKVLAGTLDAKYLVVLNKESGEVRYSGRWYYKHHPDFDWVF